MATLKRLETKSGSWVAWLSVLALAAGCGSSSVTVDAGGGQDHPQASDATNDFGGPKRGDAADGIQESATQDGGGGDAVAEAGEDAPITCAPACPADQICLANGQCETVCGQGQTKCGATCTDLAIDSKNCGTCGAACPSNQFCSQGKCVMACGQGETKCGQSCVNLSNNYQNCGACGLSCTNLEACVMQFCKCVAPNASCNGACISLNNNHDNCGACNNRCGGDFVCNGNSCGCPGGRQSCPNKTQRLRVEPEPLLRVDRGLVRPLSERDHRSQQLRRLRPRVRGRRGVQQPHVLVPRVATEVLRQRRVHS